MRFVPPIAALADGTVRFDGDEQAYARPMAPLLGALNASAPGSTATATRFRSPSPATRSLPGGDVTVDASASSQFVSGLLLAGARYADGIDIRHIGGEIPSRPHIEMTVAMLRARGVEIDDTAPNRWVVSPGADPAAGRDDRAGPVQRRTVPGRRRDHRRHRHGPALAERDRASRAMRSATSCSSFGAEVTSRTATLRGAGHRPHPRRRS